MRTLKKLIKAATDDIGQITLDELRFLIDKADSAYYRPGLESFIPDSVYDDAKNRLKSEAPDDERNTRVGVPYSPEELRTKVKHSIPMGSLDNTDDGILGYDKWIGDMAKAIFSSSMDTDKIEILASLKIDGGSIRARYEKGKLVVVATRGNGEVGENITANGINFQNLPLELPEPITCDVRGEAILYVEDFRKLVEAEYGKPFNEIPVKETSNPRNVGNGILGRDNGKDSSLVRFLTFNIVTEDRDYSSEREKFEHMRQLGFQPVPHKLCKGIDEVRSFYDSSASGRDNLPFEIDGVVVVVNDIDYQNSFVTDDIKTRLRPKYARAIKFPHRAAVTTLESVDLSVGHTGAIIPTAVLEEVRIGGVNVEHALLNNWDEINRLGIGVGDEVEVILAGDIIPKVIRCVKKASKGNTVPEPTHCPSCGKETTRELRGKEGAVTYCSDPANCPSALLAKVDHWIGGSKKGVGILGVGDTILKALWEQGIVKDPSDLYLLTADMLKDIELDGGGRIGESRAKMIVGNIQDKRELPLHTFLGSLGIELLGRRRVQILQKSAGGQLDTLDDWLDTERMKTIKIEGLGDTIRQAIISGIETNRDLIKRFLDKGVVVGEPKQEQGQSEVPSALPFDGLNFCLTGTRECQDDIERLGGTLKSGVSKKLDFLVQKDPTSSSNKTIKAEEYGVRIISIAYLKKAIKGEVSLGDVDTKVPQPSQSPRVQAADDADALVDDLV